MSIKGPRVSLPLKRFLSYDDEVQEPKIYPDPSVLQASITDLNNEEHGLVQTIYRNKVLEPYLQTDQKHPTTVSISSTRKEPESPLASKPQDDTTLKDRLAKIFPDITEKNLLKASILETADVLKGLLKANTAVVYLVSPSNNNELFQLPKFTSSSQKLSWEISQRSIMATYTASIKHHVISNDVLADDRFHDGLGFGGITVKFGLCVPILSPDGKVLGVLEFSKDAYQTPFDNKDVQIVLAVSGWIGVAVVQNSYYNTMTRQKELTDYLVHLTYHHFSYETDKEQTISSLIDFAKKSIAAERCRFYILDKQTKDGLIVSVFDQGFETSDCGLYKSTKNKKIETGSSPLSRVFLKKELVNEHCFDSEEGKVSLLCVPIICDNEVVGAMELSNRILTFFDVEDEEALREIALICSIHMIHKKVHDALKTSQIRNNIFTELLFHHMKPCIHDEKKLYDKTLSISDIPEGFFTFSWYPTPNDMPRLAELTIFMFQEVMGEVFMERNNIRRFVLTVQKCYRSVPYHNFLHAFTVAHTMANVLAKHHKMFNQIEIIGLMIASLCHDLDHRGYNNNFLHLTKHYLFSLYDSSPLENHHSAVTKMILDQCGMFKNIKEEIYKQLMQEIYELIISTDLSVYLQSIVELVEIANEKRLFTFKDHKERRLVKGLLITACDLSGQTKPMPFSKKITEDIYEEFFLQGDAEKAIGLEPFPVMNRELKHMIAENQVQFLTTVVIPCFKSVSWFFDCMEPVVLQLNDVLKEWQELIHLRKSDLWVPEDSFKSQKILEMYSTD